jgi:hypothetical protein
MHCMPGIFPHVLGVVALVPSRARRMDSLVAGGPQRVGEMFCGWQMFLCCLARADRIAIDHAYTPDPPTDRSYRLRR